MLYIDPGLTLLVLVPMPLIAFSTRFFGSRMHQRYQRVQAAFGGLTETVRERFTGIRIIKAFNQQAASTARIAADSLSYVGENLKLVRITRSFFPMMMLFSNISLALVLYLGGRRTITGVITPGDFVAFISYLGLLTWPMMALGWLTNLIQRGKASLDRIAAIVDIRPDITDGPGVEPRDRHQAAVIFDAVGFGYDAAPVLHEISFTLPRGRILGIVGPPGSGKTSLLSLIPRLYDVTAGSIRVDGVDVRDYTLHQLRSLVSYMPQEPFLFSGTIADNILLHRRPADGRRLGEVLAAAALEEMVDALAGGLETPVGERGVVLSGGQKQRIALARALIDPAPLLLLDDPISQVDTQTGGAIIGSIRAQAARRSVIIVSHRLSALSFADRILVMRDGRIAAAGDHETLLAANAYYARTFALQELEEEAHAG
jgi:ATP-binding cassette subfamily B protein